MEGLLFAAVIALQYVCFSSKTAKIVSLCLLCLALLFVLFQIVVPVSVMIAESNIWIRTTFVSIFIFLGLEIWKKKK